MDEIELRLAEKLGNEIKDLVGDFVARHHAEILQAPGEDSDRGVILGGLAGAAGYVLAGYSKAAGFTKGKLIGFTDLFKKMVDQVAEDHYDKDLNI